MVFKLTWTLNGLEVPLEKRAAAVVDPENLAGEAPGAGQVFAHPCARAQFTLVNLKASADMGWFYKALGLRLKWWKEKRARLPLLLEIRQSIKERKGRAFAGSTRRLPRESEAMTLVKVRGKVLWVQNRSNFVTLGLRPRESEGEVPRESEGEVLQWFVKELEKDVELLKAKGAARESLDSSEEPGEDSEESEDGEGGESGDDCADEGLEEDEEAQCADEDLEEESEDEEAKPEPQDLLPQADSKRRALKRRAECGPEALEAEAEEEGDQFLDLVEGTLKDLRKHSQCSRAWWIGGSQKRLRVRRWYGLHWIQRDFYVNKVRKDKKGDEGMREQIERAAGKALEFLGKGP